MIDTHCHIDFKRYHKDRDAVIERAAAAGVNRIINPGIDLQTSRNAIKLAAEYDGIYAAVGIHPNSTVNYTAAMLDEIETLARQPKVVAIGEIGLDYYRDRSPKEKQIRAFEAQLTLAARLKLPIIIHNRESSDDMMDILENWARDLPDAIKQRPGVLHSFSAPVEIAERAINMGFCLGFSGPITFKKADDLRRVAAAVPLDHILVETDGPFLTPDPYRGKRNEPAYIPYIVERLAEVKSTSTEEMAQITTENAVRLFQM